MIGAILGDIIGSPYEFDENNVKTKEFPLFSEDSRFTDDTVMTVAVAKAFLDAGTDADDDTIRASLVQTMQDFGHRYPDAGYGGRFITWLDAADPKPYHSFGNGSAMRVSPVAWLYDDLDAVRHAARLSAEVTHDHPEGIKGAEATASAIFLARAGNHKSKIAEYIQREFGYDLSRSCGEIRPTYRHVESCMETVPEAITAFLEGDSFEDVIRTAVSLGGDSDTLTAIAGSIAEAYYGISEELVQECCQRLTRHLCEELARFEGEVSRRAAARQDPGRLHDAIVFATRAHKGQLRKGTDLDYLCHPMEVLQILTAMGADMDTQIAGVLHDTVEDTAVTLEEIRARFDGTVADLVGHHSEDKSKSWEERKTRAIEELRDADFRLKMLVMADKVSNLRSIQADYRELGETVWDRFNAPREKQSWYYSSIQDALCEMQDSPDTAGVYWEMVGLYKDLFVKFYMSVAGKRLYQASAHGETYMCAAEHTEWVASELPDPADLCQISREEAERLEDLWR